MAYSTYTDVNDLLGAYEATSNTIVTTANITSFISQIDREIDNILEKNGLSTPVAQTDDPKLYARLQDLSKWGATAMAFRVIFPAGEHSMGWWDSYTRGLEDLRHARGPAVVPSTHFTSDFSPVDSGRPLFEVAKIW